jgi:hypothetical protein
LSKIGHTQQLYFFCDLPYCDCFVLLLVPFGDAVVMYSNCTVL